MRGWICAALFCAAVCLSGNCAAAPTPTFDFRLTRTEGYWVSEVWLRQELVWQVAFSTGEAVVASTGAPQYRTVVTPDFSEGLFYLKLR